MSPPAILVVTGASGAGKTSAVEALEARGLPGVRCHYFDRAGVPSSDEMERDFGGPERWQEMTTERWIAHLAASAGDDGSGGRAVAVLEGQMRPHEARGALLRAGIASWQIVLIDCDTDARNLRLTGPRGQPDLANARMDAWAAYLRGQTDALGLPMIDTTHLTVDQTADALQALVEVLRRTTTGG